MDIKRIKIADINPAPYNPRVDLKPGDPAYERLAKSIEEFGVVDPLIWNKRTGTLVGGHQRLKILIARGDKLADVSVVDLPIEREKALNIALNKISGDWNVDLLVGLLGELEVSLDDFEITGFSLDEFHEMLPPAVIDGDGDPDEAPEPPKNPTTKPGDLFALGRHRLLCGDSTSRDDVAKLLDGAKAEWMWTDPPYGVDYVGKTKDALKIENDGSKGLAELLKNAFACADEILINGSPIYIAHPGGPIQVIFGNAFIDIGWKFHEQLIWAKNSMVMGHSDYHYKHELIIYGWKGKNRTWIGDRSQVSVFEIDRPSRSESHPTMKPVDLIVSQLKNSAKRESIGYEPFCGSGSTLIAAEKIGATCFAMELSPAYCDVIIERYKTFTGRDDVALLNGKKKKAASKKKAAKKKAKK